MSFIDTFPCYDIIYTIDILNKMKNTEQTISIDELEDIKNLLDSQCKEQPINVSTLVTSQEQSFETLKHTTNEASAYSSSKKTMKK